MEIMFSRPWPWISLISADPSAVSRNVTSSGMPWLFFPCQVPERDLSWVKDFCASDWPKAAAEIKMASAATAIRTEWVVIFIMECFLSFFGVVKSQSCSFGLAGELRFFFVFGFYKGFEAGQIRAPETAVVFEPGVNRAQRLWVELVDAVAAFAMLLHQMRPAQQAKMLGDCWAGNGKGLRNVSGGLAAAAQQIEDGAAGGIGECLKGGFRRICNRSVPHNA